MSVRILLRWPPLHPRAPAIANRLALSSPSPRRLTQSPTTRPPTQGVDFGKLPGVYCNGLQVYGRTGELVWEQCVSSSVVEKVVAACAAVESGTVSLVGYDGDDLQCLAVDERTDELHSK